MNANIDFVKPHTALCDLRSSLPFRMTVLCRSWSEFEITRQFLWSINRPTHHKAPWQNWKLHSELKRQSLNDCSPARLLFYHLAETFHSILLTSFDVLDKIRSIFIGTEKLEAICTLPSSDTVIRTNCYKCRGAFRRDYYIIAYCRLHNTHHSQNSPSQWFFFINDSDALVPELWVPTSKI